MRQSDSPSLDGVLENDDLLYPYCYVCNLSLLQDGTGFCQMFPEVGENDLSTANILSDILEIDVTKEVAHSKIVCVDCNMLCIEYQQLIQRANTIRIEMTMAYNQTVTKIKGMIEKDLKEAEVGLVDNEEHLESSLQTFNKELMSMEEVFQMEGMGSETIEGDRFRSNVHMEDSLPKIDLVWQTSEAETQHIDNNSLMRIDADTVLINQPGTDANQEQEQLMLGSENCSPVFQPVESIVETESSSRNLCSDDKFERLISESHDGVVEVSNEDGIPIYCIYEDVIESYSDAEEHTEIVKATPDNMIEYDAVVESPAQAMESPSDPIEETNPISRIMPDDNVQEPEPAAPSTSNTVTDSENHSLQPLFIKIDKMYYCTLCSTEGQVDSYNVKTIAVHLKKEHGKKILVCEQCDAVFYRRPTYNEHMDQHTAEQFSDFCCDICNVKFPNVRTLRVHRRKHTAVRKMWPCDICEKKFAARSMYEGHMNMHNGARPFKCTECPKDFASKYILAVHMRTHKERARTFKCNQCGSSFYSRNNLVHHEKTHNATRDFPCNVCGKTFLTQHNLSEHMIAHNAIKQFTCRTCGKAFARKTEILDHERIHTGEKPFACDMCDATFAQRSNLCSHKRMTHLNDKRFKCDVCGACFKRRRLLIYHNRAAHTGERPYKCELCNSTFVYPEHFHKHKRIHTGNKPFACEVCHKTFNSRDNRNAHRYVHSDKKPFECVTCGLNFMRKSQLYTHMQTRGHLNDTIVVNQPRITENDTVEYEIESIAADQDLVAQDEDIVYEEENIDDMIETDAYYLQDTEQQEEAGHLLEVASSTNSNMELITNIEIDDSDWSNFIEKN